MVRARPWLVCAALICVVWLVSQRVHAERLIVSVSNPLVTITPNYAGEELVLFGSVERNSGLKLNRTGYDLVVTVRGPRVDLVTRRKERKLGIWVNTDSRPFLKVPSYLAIFANQPFDAIAQPDMQRQLQLGLDHVPLTQRIGTDYGDVVTNDPFRRAFIQLQAKHGLYREEAYAVRFLTPTLFRTSIPLPAKVPIGSYDVDIKLLAHGALVAKTETTFEIAKVGFEQFVANAARQRPFIYGMVTIIMALITGWLATVVFHRD